MGSNYSSTAQKDIMLILLGSVLTFIGFILFTVNFVFGSVFVITGVTLIGIYASKFKSDKINQDCQVSEWSNCSVSCGGGTQTRTVIKQPTGTGLSCPTLSQNCNTQSCTPVDCQVSWSEWTNCSAPCGGGTQSRTGTITKQPQYGGASCPTNLIQTRVCNTSSCPKWSLTGCYNDTPGASDNSQRILPNQLLANYDTLENCEIQAQQLGYDVIGLQDGQIQDGIYKAQCFADKSSNYPNNPTFYATLGTSEACQGNMGSGYVNSVYKYQ